jgi:hypothetical protein
MKIVFPTSSLNVPASSAASVITVQQQQLLPPLLQHTVRRQPSTGGSTGRTGGWATCCRSRSLARSLTSASPVRYVAVAKAIRDLRRHCRQMSLPADAVGTAAARRHSPAAAKSHRLRLGPQPGVATLKRLGFSHESLVFRVARATVRLRRVIRSEMLGFQRGTRSGLTLFEALRTWRLPAADLRNDRLASVHAVDPRSSVTLMSPKTAIIFGRRRDDGLRNLPSPSGDDDTSSIQCPRSIHNVWSRITAADDVHTPIRPRAWGRPHAARDEAKTAADARNRLRKYNAH